MFKLIKKLLKLIFPILVGLALAISLPLYFLSQRVTNRENMRTWLKTNKVKEAYKDHITKEITEDANLSIITILIPEEDITTLVNKQINDNWIENSIDNAVDSTYDWLEGKKQDEENSKAPINLSENKDLNSILQPSTGSIGELLGLTNENLFGIDIPLINLNDKFTELLPKTYIQLTLLPQRLLILNAILLAILIFSSKNGREASFRLGLTLTIAGGLLIFGPNYISKNPDSLSIIGIHLESLPQLSELPLYAQNVVELAKIDITKDITELHYWSLCNWYSFYNILSIRIKRC